VERIRDAHVAITIETNRRTLTERIELRKDESVLEFRDRVNDTLARMERAAND
jgi:hypothetical protein